MHWKKWKIRIRLTEFDGAIGFYGRNYWKLIWKNVRYTDAHDTLESFAMLMILSAHTGPCTILYPSDYVVGFIIPVVLSFYKYIPICGFVPLFRGRFICNLVQWLCASPLSGPSSQRSELCPIVVVSPLKDSLSIMHGAFCKFEQKKEMNILLYRVICIRKCFV